MSVDYEALRTENRLEYGRAIGRIGKSLLEDRYDKRTHFIYEVLQNAEDALRRRSGWSGSRAVSFDLTRSELRISHFGAPFDANDVKGICGIDESTKGITSIGRFGIGFKSVYAFTREPEIYSGDEAFSIVDYVFPHAIAARDRASDETLIVLPLKADDSEAFHEIAEGLRSLGSEALLFLKHVQEVRWTVEAAGGGSYRRTSAGGEFSRVVELETIVGLDVSRSEYLLFSRDVVHEGRPVGQAEIAFSLEANETSRAVRPLPDARLVVFFPTVLPTYTGFLVQGPYRTTPSRDNIPADDPWNMELAALTAELLVDALPHVKDSGLLDISALRTLPIEKAKFGGLFSKLYERTAEALRTQKLLPTFSDRYASADEIRLARTQDVRDLLGPRHLAALLGLPGNIYWASSDITVDRAAPIRAYLMQELKVVELTLEQVLGRMTTEFLTEQSDTWMIKFYKLLESQPAVLRSPRAQSMALFRLESGEHVPLMLHGVRQVFLATDQKTEFPTLKATLQTAQTKKFLELAKLTEPDPVDDVIHHLLPRYSGDEIDDSNYDDDISRMVRAFRTDSQSQREKLVAALRNATIVMVRDAGDDDDFLSEPIWVYLAAARLVGLFAGVDGVRLLDSAYDCLRGEDVREMLEAAGATRILRTMRVDCDLGYLEKHALRKAAGWETASTEQPIADLDIDGLAELIDLLPHLSAQEARDRAVLLWEALSELVDRRPGVISVSYNWTYMAPRSTTVDPKFLRRLNTAKWIPDANGNLRAPSEMLFDDLGWPAHPVLQSRIAFKPPAIAALAREVGIETDLLDELKRRGLTRLDQLNDLIGADDAADDDDQDDQSQDDQNQDDQNQDDQNQDDQNPQDSDGAGEDDQNEGSNEDDEAGKDDPGGHKSDRGGGGEGDDSRGDGGSGADGHGGHGNGGGGGNGSGRSGSRREFVSYLGTRPEGEDQDDPDGLSHQERMALEAQAIAFIKAIEPWLEQAPVGNKGYDLIERALPEEPERLIEVKAMKGSLENRPATMSPAQIEAAREHAEMFWLYIVEHAGTPRARLLKIQNPYGRAGTFTFDKGWAQVAVVGQPPSGEAEGS